MTSFSKKIRILSVDGGGMRGIIPATILEYMEHKIGQITQNSNARIADYFDLIVGTSTGGILTCFYLAPNTDVDDCSGQAKYTATQALNFYVDKGYSIFNASKILEWGGLRQLFNATRYSANRLEQIFKQEFADLKMSDLVKPCLVTSYDIESKSAVFFSSREPDANKRDFYVRDVVRSTSAAPTYFSPAKIRNLTSGEKMVNIDGGVFANNPAMCAYAEARDTEFSGIGYPKAEDMLLLSIGTGGGQFNLPNTDKSNDWNVLKWAKSIPEIMMDGSIDTVDYQMKHLFGALEGENRKNYKRINVPLNKRHYSNNMADASPSNILALQKAGQEALKAALVSSEFELGLDEFIRLLL